jgi:hypothetical protein
MARIRDNTQNANEDLHWLPERHIDVVKWSEQFFVTDSKDITDATTYGKTARYVELGVCKVALTFNSTFGVKAVLYTEVVTLSSATPDLQQSSASLYVKSDAHFSYNATTRRIFASSPFL